MYSRNLPPYLGSSIGAGSISGTLTAYVRQKFSANTVYALTCCHCVVGDSVKPLQGTIPVHAPSVADTEATVNALSARVGRWQNPQDIRNWQIVRDYDNFLGVVESVGRPGNHEDWALVKLQRPVVEGEIGELNKVIHVLAHIYDHG